MVSINTILYRAIIVAKLRTKLNKADEAYIKANLHLNSLEISEEIGLDQLVVADCLKAARKDMTREPGRLKVDGKVVGATLTEAMMGDEQNRPPRDNLGADYIFRRKNMKKK